VLENEGVIASVLEEVRGCVELLNVEIEEKSKGISTVKGIADNVARFWPHLHHTGGFFIAKFRKISKLPETTVSPRNTLVTRLSEENADPFMVVPAEKIAE
jgi:hypothetical protein